MWQNRRQKQNKLSYLNVSYKSGYNLITAYTVLMRLCQNNNDNASLPLFVKYFHIILNIVNISILSFFLDYNHGHVMSVFLLSSFILT